MGLVPTRLGLCVILPWVALAWTALGCGPSTSTAAPSSPPPKPAPAEETAAKPPEARVERRAVVIFSRKSGSSVTTFAPDGSIEMAFEYLDNGRGPKVTGRARVAADGTLASLDAKGTRTFGTAIDETFGVSGKRARWKSTEEQGDTELASPAFYVPNAGLPQMTALLYAALQKNGGKIALLPDGEARLARSGTFTARAQGKEKRLVAWEITGLYYAPTRLWTEEDGTYFGEVDPAVSIVPEGWEEAIDPLVKAQKEFEKAHDRDLVARLSHKGPAEGVVFTHARVLDVERKRWLDDHAVTVVGGKIVAVGPTKNTKVPEGAEVIDAKGKALLPGLWEMHAHLSVHDGVMGIASGVTTARDLGNDPDTLDDFKKRFDEGTAIGPHILRSGFIEGRGEKAASSKITAETPDEAKRAVEFYAQRHYEGIKIYNSVKPELVPLLAKLAHEKKMRVSGHVPVHMRAEEVVRAGYDEIQHINMLFLNFFVDKDTDTRTPLRFILVAEKAPGLDLQSKPVKDFLKLLVEKKTVVDPTVFAFWDLFTGRPGRVTEGLEPMVARLPVQVRREFLTGGLAVTGEKDALYKEAYGKLLQMVKALYDAKIPIVAGTDSDHFGLALHQELALYVRAGIPAADVLQLATLGAAKVMHLEKTSGSVAPGKDADFFLVEGDPLARIEDLRHVSTTVRSGVVYASAPLYETVGVKP
ncbi:amidohydrolase family protein [Pendulispora brunnea]|uniref:Amidohydrolase family protein n=1 Tax=Pendulispora brunnea TaxID=2905690 RepID=A0ABZ2KUC8_9BACT